MPTEQCLHCTHADLRQAAANGMKGFVKCQFDEAWTHNSPIWTCKIKRFQMASDDVVSERVKWWERKVRK